MALFLVNGEAAVGGEDLAGDVGGPGRGEEDEGRRHFLGLGPAAHRDLLQVLVLEALVSTDHLGHRRRRPGGDGIDGDAVAGQLPGAGLGQPGDAGLGGAVIDLADGADDARRRGDVDDAAPLPFHHSRHHRLGAVEAAAQVHVEHRAPLLHGHLVQHRRAYDSGIIHEDVDAPVAGRDGRRHGVDAGPVGDVAAYPDGLAAGRAYKGGAGFGRLGGEIDDRHPRPFPGIGGRHRGADALGGAGDDGDPLGEDHDFGLASTCSAKCSSNTAPAATSWRYLTKSMTSLPVAFLASKALKPSQASWLMLAASQWRLASFIWSQKNFFLARMPSIDFIRQEGNRLVNFHTSSLTAASSLLKSVVHWVISSLPALKRSAVTGSP